MQVDDNVAGVASTSRSNKEGKSGRIRLACLRCRSKRSKCAGKPPNPCTKCTELGVECTWPAVDGRSLRPSGLMGSASIGHGAKTLDDLIRDRSGGEWRDLTSLFTATAGNGTPATIGAAMSQSGSGGIGNALSQLGSSSVQPIGQPTNTYWTPSEAGPSASASKDAVAQSINFSFPLDMPDGVWRPDTGSSDQQAWSQLNLSASPFNGQVQDLQALSLDEILGLVAQHQLSNLEETEIQAQTTKTIIWRRHHGVTAIAPGLKRIMLKVKVKAPPTTTSPPTVSSRSPFPSVQEDMNNDLFDSEGMPARAIMEHLIDVFATHFESQIPYLDKAGLQKRLQTDCGSLFLFNCIASVAARFSNHPSIAKPHLQPYEYGDPFNERAKSLLGSMLGVPSRDTVAGFLLLALTGAGNDSESEVWMMIGNAVRMSIDLGLHLNQTAQGTSDEDSRLDRLLFWSVLMLDYVLSFGVGRTTTLPPRAISQPLPDETDVHPRIDGRHSEALPRSPFPYAARIMTLFGPLINQLNDPDQLENDQAIRAARIALVNEYNRLPSDMQWNVRNLQLHNKAEQAPIFVWLHLWLHTILASEILTTSERQRKPDRPFQVAGTATLIEEDTPISPSPAADMWRNSARTIVDILEMSDLVNPFVYLVLELVNQCFYVAACCFVKEIEQFKSTAYGHVYRQPMTAAAPENPGSTVVSGQISPSGNLTTGDASLLIGVAKEKLQALRHALDKQTRYWSSIAWIAGTLTQRVEGIRRDDLDLAEVTGKLHSYVSLPDAGLAHQEVERCRK